MASTLEYMYTCQICFEEFEDTGDHVPRLLPCTHTLCEKCIGKLLRGNSLQCPECRVKHPAERGKKSFPQNKYILVNIQRKPALVVQETEETRKPTLDLCEKHNRERSLYCTEATCQKPICPLCLKDDHKNHEFDDIQILEEKRRRSTWESVPTCQVTKTFCTSIYNVTDLTQLNDESVLLSEVWGNQRQVKQYSLHDGRQAWSQEWEDTSVNICNVALNGRRCLAISFGDKMKIEFRDINNLSKVVLSHSVAPRIPGRMCRTSPTTLLYEDLSTRPRSIHRLDCRTSPSEPTTGAHVIRTKQHNIKDLICMKNRDKQLLIITDILKGVYAYNTNTGELEWSVEDNVPGKSGQLQPIGVTSNDYGHLFVSNGTALVGGCVEMFSAGGKHMGTIVNKEEGLLRARRIRWNSKTSSLVVTHLKSGHKVAVSLVNALYPHEITIKSLGPRNNGISC